MPGYRSYRRELDADTQARIIKLYVDPDCPQTQVQIASRLGVPIGRVTKTLKNAGVSRGKRRTE